MAKITTPDSLYGNSRDILREAERENEILADIAGEEYESPGDIPKGKYVIEKRLLDAAQKKNELLESIAEGSGTISGANKLAIDYGTDVLSLKKGDEPIANSGVTLPAYGVSFDPATGGLTLTKNGTAVSGQTVTIPNYGSPVAVTASSGMTDHDLIYLYEGTTGGGYTNGHFYYWDGTAWADGGEYAAATVQTDKTLLVEDRAADAKATGEAVGELKTQIDPYTKDFGILHDNIEYSKNLAVMFDSSKTVSSVDMSWTKDNVVTWNGTSTATGGRTTRISNKISLPAGVYTLSVTPLNSAASSLATRLTINVVDTSYNIIFSASRLPQTHTFDADTDVYLSFSLSNGTTYNNAQAGVMLNAGDTALPFESYYHGIISDEQARDDIDTLETKISNKPFLPFKDKKIVVFGDSRTWYDGQTYGENTKSEWAGKTCVGYQDALKKILDTDDITNEGVSGNTSPQICDRVRLYDFTGFDAVLLDGGVNDWVKSSKPEPGTLLPVGSTFDTTTIYGAWQSAVEYILTNYPSIQIFMDVPAIAWTSNGVYPYKTAIIKAEVAKLYNIPCKDMYKELGINEVNRDYYYCDDVNATGWRVHFNDYGNALFGTVMAQFMNTVCGDITYAGTEEKTAEIYPVVKATSEDSKNIIRLNNTSTTVSTNVVVASNEQNEITYNGTSAGTTGRTKKLSDLHALPAGTYTLSAKYNNPETYNWRTRLAIYVCDSAKNTIAQFAGTPQTFTINAETNVYISTTVSTGTVCGGFSLSVMLNEGGTALPFELPEEWSAIDVKARSELGNIVSADSMRRIMERNYAIPYANAVNRLNLINVYGTNQNVHPKVLYFDTLFGGHRYWMAYTPYTNESTLEENPCIAYSEDGIDWTNIAGNPLATGTADNYYSDTHLVYNSTTGLLECWYRLASNTDNAEYIYRNTSTDGVTWGTQELMQTFTNGKSHALSPSVIWDATNQKYQIWVVNGTGGYHVDYYESTNGTTWTKIREITLTYSDDGTSYYVWHIDVSLIDGVYYLIAMCKNEDSSVPWTLFVATSSDNTTYTTPVILMYPQANAWDEYLYRSCIVKTADDYRLYYSARRNNGTQGMSISIASSLYKFIGYDLIS